MATYVYKCLECENEYDVVQSMKDDKFKEYDCPSCNKKTGCERLIVYSGPAIWVGGAPTMNFASRGYGGKFSNKLRPRGTPVDCPQEKAIADRAFQAHLDSGGLEGIEPSFKIGPQTTDQLLDKKYAPASR